MTLVVFETHVEAFDYETGCAAPSPGNGRQPRKLAKRKTLLGSAGMPGFKTMLLVGDLDYKTSCPKPYPDNGQQPKKAGKAQEPQDSAGTPEPDKARYYARIQQ